MKSRLPSTPASEKAPACSAKPSERTHAAASATLQRRGSVESSEVEAANRAASILREEPGLEHDEEERCVNVIQTAHDKYTLELLSRDVKKGSICKYSIKKT